MTVSESVRPEHYADCRASATVSRLSPPAFSVMPDVSPTVDLPPLLLCVTPGCFSKDLDSSDDTTALLQLLLIAIAKSDLDSSCFTLSDTKDLLPPEFASLSKHDQNSLLHYLCSAECCDAITLLRSDEELLKSCSLNPDLMFNPNLIED